MEDILEGRRFGLRQGERCYIPLYRKLKDHIGNLIRFDGQNFWFLDDRVDGSHFGIVMLLDVHFYTDWDFFEDAESIHLTSAVDADDTTNMPVVEVLWEGRVINAQFHEGAYIFIDPQDGA